MELELEGRLAVHQAEERKGILLTRGRDAKAKMTITLGKA